MKKQTPRKESPRSHCEDCTRKLILISRNCHRATGEKKAGCVCRKWY